MSWGMCICSKCKREVHQARRKDESLYWFHCFDKSDICPEARADYAKNVLEVVGKYCGADGVPSAGMPTLLK